MINVWPHLLSLTVCVCVCVCVFVCKLCISCRHDISHQYFTMCQLKAKAFYKTIITFQKDNRCNSSFFSNMQFVFEFLRLSPWYQLLFKSRTQFLFICLCQALVVARGTFDLHCGMWDLVPRPGIKSRSPSLGAWSLSHWTAREVPMTFHFRRLQASRVKEC